MKLNRRTRLRAHWLPRPAWLNALVTAAIVISACGGGGGGEPPQIDALDEDGCTLAGAAAPASVQPSSSSASICGGSPPPPPPQAEMTMAAVTSAFNQAGRGSQCARRRVRRLSFMGVSLRARPPGAARHAQSPAPRRAVLNGA